MSKSFKLVFLLGFVLVFTCCCLAIFTFQAQVRAVEADTEAIVAWGYQSSSVNLIIPSAIAFETHDEAMVYLLEYKNYNFVFQCHNGEAVNIGYDELDEIECDQGLVAVYKN